MLPGLIGLAVVVVLGGAFVWASQRLSNWIYRRTAGGPKIPLRQRMTARKVPFRFATRAIPGEGALAAWEMAKTEGRGLPVIVGGEFGLTRIIEAYDRLSHIRPETILAQADAITDPLPVRGRRKKPGDWPETVVETKGPTVSLRLHSEPLDEVHLVFVPARTAADIPAFLRLGGWNSCPEAALMVAALRKWQKEYQYRLIKELWAYTDNRIAVRFAYEWHDETGQWFRSYGNENWLFDEHGLMRNRYASINDVPILEFERVFHWSQGRRPDEHPGLSDLGF